MKLATLVPLLKKDNIDKSEIKNFRPVSNLSFILKLLEKGVSEQVIKYLEDQAFCRSARQRIELVTHVRLLYSTYIQI